MKKALIIIGIIAVILVGIVLIVFNTLNKEKTPITEDKSNTLNKGKTPITAAEFNNIMENEGYVMTNTTSQFAQYPNYISESYVAQKSGYQIEFYELTSEENAISMYNTNEAKFESQKTNAAIYTTVSIKNYATYSLTTNGKYKYLSRIDNTLVYIDVDESYKDIVKDIMKEIGY